MLSPIAGVRLTGFECNVRYKNRTDVMLMEMAPGSTIAGVLTKSLTRSAPVDLCRVAGTSKPSSDSNINFEVWIPTNGRWNGKYEQIGNGGFAGTIWVSYIADAVSRGYAAAATDVPPGAADVVHFDEGAVIVADIQAEELVVALQHGREQRLSSEVPSLG